MSGIGSGWGEIFGAAVATTPRTGRIKISEYAAMRGVTRQAVEKVAKEHGIALTGSPKTIDPVEADRVWTENVGPRRGPGADRGVAPELARARQRKMDADASLAELNLARARSELVSVEDARRLWFRLARATRDRVLAIADREAAELATMTDPAMVAYKLRKVLGDALSGAETEPKIAEQKK